MIINMNINMRDERKSYTDETSAGAEREGLGYFSSKIPTITSESEIHLSSNFISGTFPSGFTSKNLQKIPSRKRLYSLSIKPQTKPQKPASVFEHFIPLGLGVEADQMQLILNFLLFQSQQNPLAKGA